MKKGPFLSKFGHCIRDPNSSSVYVLAKIDPVALTVTCSFKLNVTASATGSIPAYPRTHNGGKFAYSRTYRLGHHLQLPLLCTHSYFVNIHMYVIQFLGVHVLIRRRTFVYKCTIFIFQKYQFNEFCEVHGLCKHSYVRQSIL